MGWFWRYNTPFLETGDACAPEFREHTSCSSPVAEHLGPDTVTEYRTLEGIGVHYIAELYGCPAHLLNDPNFIRTTIIEAVRAGNATLLREVAHHFEPQGVTALGLLAESHISIHTWPEMGYAGADVFTCGEQASAERACRYVVQALQPQRHDLRRINRGIEITGENQYPKPGQESLEPSFEIAAP